MDKAFDTKDLVERLKSRGLDVAEDSVKGVCEDLFAWFEESAKLSENKFDDMTLVVLPEVKKLLMNEIDKIDGKED